MILPPSRRRSSASAQFEWQGQHALAKLALFSLGRSLVQVGALRGAVYRMLVVLFRFSAAIT